MNKHDICRLTCLDQLHDSFSICMSREGHVLDGHPDVQSLFVVQLDFSCSSENLVPNRSCDTIAWHNYHVIFIRSPFLEYLKRQSCMKHAWSSKDNHWTRIIDVLTIKRFDVLEVKHVSLNKRTLDLLVRPCNKHLVVIGCLLCQTNCKVNGNFQIHSLPISFEEDAQFLSSSESKDRNEDFTSTIDTIVYFEQKVSFSAPLTVSDRGCIR